jgi:hypothetical protein
VTSAPPTGPLRQLPSTRRRASRAQVRLLAWTASAVSFVGGFASLTLSPQPAQGAPRIAEAPSRDRPVVVVITKRIIVSRAVRAPAQPTGSVQYAPAPATAPVAVSCGTPPC